LVALFAASCALGLLAAPAGAVLPTHAEIPSLNQTGFERVCGIAIDSAGNRYLADYESDKVEVFSPSGASITSFTPSANAESPCTLAVDSQGNVYVNGLETDVVKYKPSSFPPTSSTSYEKDTAINGTGKLVAEGAYAVAVNPATDNVYVAFEGHISSYEPDGTPISETLGEAATGGASFTSVAVRGSTGKIYAYARTFPGKAYVLSPDGSRVVFSRVEAGTRSLSVVSTEGGPPSPVCADCSIPGDWSPDRKHVLLGKGVPSRLVVHDLSTGEQAELTAHPTWNLHQAHFSRDAQWVAFHTTNSPNVRQIYATRAERGKSNRPQDWVPVVTDHGCHPSWSADGSLLYHFSFRDGAFCPWVQQIDPVTKRPTGPPRAVVHLHNPGLRATTGAAATNVIRAGYFYFTATESTGNIWMLDDRRD